ncbi:MAG: DUF5107 domain-containing protein [Tannerellaceae bacterium]|jgi:hypothetical protein|nr:DUF5107 domain-containing protein [Tannerellaceae bacterium]
MNGKYLFLLFLLTYGNNLSFARQTDSLVCEIYESVVLTHVLTPAGPLPPVIDPNGVYPYMSYSETSNRPVPELYKMISLENSRIKVEICPDLGGKITSLQYKSNGKNVLYDPQIIRHTRILPRFYFVAGGIEVSFPISHSPSQNESLLYKIEETAGRIYVTCGERELHQGMQWSVEYSLGKDDTCLTQRVLIHNPGAHSYSWMSWSNAALPGAPDTRFDFPDGEVLVHASILDTISWRKNGPEYERDIKEMTGFFWKTKDVNAFGAFTPSLGTGLYHVAEEKSVPGIKLWSYGVEDDKEWAMLSSSRQQAYIEIQGGPASDQSIKMELQPDEKMCHVEYWIPTNKALDIYTIHIPPHKLRPIDEIPLFGWARQEEVQTWTELQDAYEGKARPPRAPDPATADNWAPSGMENLDKPFRWIIRISQGKEKDYWRYYYGVWLAGRERVDEATDILEKSDTDLSKAVLARLYEVKGELSKAETAYDSIADSWLSLHPQFVVARDKLLQKAGRHTLGKREFLLAAVNASPDEWIAERNIRLLIDKGEYLRAKEALLSTAFQKVHQTYERTELWKIICNGLGLPEGDIPRRLGEDKLARFGAYRAYE